ncbi:MAG: hypothetical protein KTR31_02105 [Myxococcales bacterium]|nr:hypothetical protein [Myxococcales bacterium]
MRLSWSVRPRPQLADDELAGMLRVHRSLYAGVDPQRFQADLDDKDEVVLLSDEQGTIRGYTTLSVYRDETGWVLFSGDTGVERCAWGSSALAVGWLSAAMRWYDQVGPLSWLLLAGGARTYRYLPLFFREHWPRHDEPTPPAVRDRLEALAQARYGARYQDGIVHLDQPPLRAEHDAPRPTNPHDVFFRSANPGWTQGCELVCLTTVDPGNLTAAGARILQRAGRG